MASIYTFRFDGPGFDYRPMFEEMTMEQARDKAANLVAKNGPNVKLSVYNDLLMRWEYLGTYCLRGEDRETVWCVDSFGDLYRVDYKIDKNTIELLRLGKEEASVLQGLAKDMGLTEANGERVN